MNYYPKWKYPKAQIVLSFFNEERKASLISDLEIGWFWVGLRQRKRNRRRKTSHSPSIVSGHFLKCNYSKKKKNPTTSPSRNVCAANACEFHHNSLRCRAVEKAWPLSRQLRNGRQAAFAGIGTHSFCSLARVTKPELMMGCLGR